jgi:uncharacterized metal-binding protein YceD (DUF177 family)
MKAPERGSGGTGLGVPAPELSRPYSAARLSSDGEAFKFEANAAERAALAKRFELIDLPSFSAEGRISSTDHGHGVRVEGVVRAEVVQACVVTLEPVPAKIEEPFVRNFTDRSGTVNEETVLDMEQDDPPDPIVGGTVDIGEAVAETFGLALDPYPRAPGAALPGEDSPAAADVTNLSEKQRESPFSALKGLIKKP